MVLYYKTTDLQTGLQPKSGLLPVCVNKVLLDTVILIHLHIMTAFMLQQ